MGDPPYLRRGTPPDSPATKRRRILRGLSLLPPVPGPGSRAVPTDPLFKLQSVKRLDNTALTQGGHRPRDFSAFSRSCALLEISLEVLVEGGGEDKGLEAVLSRINDWFVLKYRVVVVLTTALLSEAIRIRS